MLLIVGGGTGPAGIGACTGVDGGSMGEGGGKGKGRGRGKGTGKGAGVRLGTGGEPLHIINLSASTKEAILAQHA